MKYFSPVVVALLLMACNASKDLKNEQNISEEIIEIASLKKPCTGVAPRQCLQVRKENTTDFILFYDTIEGFNYETGYTYTLKIKTEKLDTSKIPADASSIKYSLVEVLKKNADSSIRLHDIWVVKEMNGEQVFKPNDKTIKQITLEIHINDMKILGNDSCNNFFGRINNLNNNAISFSELGSTKKLCPDMKIANNFSNAMKNVTNYELKNLHLYLKDKEGNILLKLLKVD